MHTSCTAMVRHTALLCWLIITAVDGYYPVGTRQCMSSATIPKGKLICPEAQRNFCVKEVVSLTKDLCGKTQYFSDIYEGNDCVLRKCSATCKEGPYSFTYQGVQYQRMVYCCDEQDFCNAASINASINYLLVCLISIGLALSLVFL